MFDLKKYGMFHLKKCKYYTYKCPVCKDKNYVRNIIKVVDKTY